VRSALAIAITLVMAAASAAAQQPAPTLDSVVGGLQAAYDSRSDFRARFTQTMHRPLLTLDKQLTGRVYFSKPGRMRWDYETPV
jgi:outer membrane lipoprotein carrier protein